MVPFVFLNIVLDVQNMLKLVLEWKIYNGGFEYE
jgi:hypothetical protein